MEEAIGALRAVVMEPNDLAARLDYAAAVGGERGEFIRLQIEDSERIRSGKTRMHGARTYALERKHRQAWRLALPEGVADPMFFRGFVELVTVDGDWFADHYQELMAAAPIRQLTIRANSGRYAACPGLAQLVGLTFALPTSVAAVTALVSSPYTSALRYLDIRGVQLADEDVAALLEALPSLDCCRVKGFAADVGRDYDGTITQIVRSTRLCEFEAKYRVFPCLSGAAEQGDIDVEGY